MTSSLATLEVESVVGDAAARDSGDVAGHLAIIQPDRATDVRDATAEVGRRSARDRQVAQPQLPAGAINLEDPDRGSVDGRLLAIDRSRGWLQVAVVLPGSATDSSDRCWYLDRRVGLHLRDHPPSDNGRQSRCPRPLVDRASSHSGSDRCPDSRRGRFNSGC